MNDRGSRPCRSCGKEIIFIERPNRKSLPCDAVPEDPLDVTEGTIVTTTGRIITNADADKLDAMKIRGPVYRPHWASCTDPEKHRRGER